MKINWGTGIVLAFIAFIGFIMFFVIALTTNKEYAHDLVTEEYYKQELAFQKEIDAEKNTRSLTKRIEVVKSENGLTIEWPSEFDGKRIEGTVSLYRPSDKKLDFTFPVNTTEAKIRIPEERLLDGRWDVKVIWATNGKEYLFKKALTY